MNILIYLAIYIGYLGICAATIYSLRAQRIKNGQELLMPEFSESFSLVKGAIYFALYWLVSVFSSRLLALSKNDFIIGNSDFFAYLFLAIVAVGLYYKFFLQAIKNVGKNLKDNLKKALLIWMIAFILMAATVVVISLCNIENKNQSSIDQSSMNMVCEFFAICLLGPIVEELVFRGILFRWLRQYTVIFAYIASGLLFGLEHGIYFVIN